MTERVGRVQQVVLLCLLAFCVTAMHHAPASAGGPDPMAATSISAATPAGDTEVGHTPGLPHGAHELLHLCLAVLTVLGGVLLVWVLLAWHTGTGVPVHREPPGSSPVPERPPDRAGRTLLTSLCVLRV